jgi:hypothetical protein
MSKPSYLCGRVIRLKSNIREEVTDLDPEPLSAMPSIHRKTHHVELFPREIRGHNNIYYPITIGTK